MIRIPYDGSPDAQPAVGRAAALARRGAEATLDETERQRASPVDTVGRVRGRQNGTGGWIEDPGVTRILLVDDHQIVRSGIRRLLEDGGAHAVVGEATDAAEALRLARRDRPDVIVLDINLGGGPSGLEVLGELRATGARVVVLSMQDEPANARIAFERGAQAYVVKSAAAEELETAIGAVLDDRLYVHPALGARFVVGESADDLTAREREVLRLIALGFTNQEIAGQVFLSVRTVESHRRHILNKLRLSTRADLVRYALDHRIVGLDV